MNCSQFGSTGKFSRSWLNLCAVFLILLINVRVNWAQNYTDDSSSNTSNDDDQLLFVSMIHRHGDRTPVSTYPTDPYKDYDWPEGSGALTQVGICQLYQLGLNVRPRYESLKPLDGIYTQKAAHAIASSPERTRMSGAAMLAAFWEPNEYEDSCIPIPYRPVPLYVIPARDDYTLYQAEVECRDYDVMYTKLLEKPDPGSSIYEFNEENQDLYDYLSKYIGQNVTNCVPASDLYDTLLIESNHGFPLPEWTKNVYPDRLKACRERAFRLTTETPYMKRMRGGPIITAVHDRMVSYLNGSSDQNIITYAAHDTTISNALTSMGIYNQTDPIPDYGALLAFEMYGKPDRKSAYIQMVYYANTTVKEPQKLDIPNCTEPCFFEMFNDVIEGLIITDYAGDCQMSTENS